MAALVATEQLSSLSSAGRVLRSVEFHAFPVSHKNRPSPVCVEYYSDSIESLRELAGYPKQEPADPATRELVEQLHAHVLGPVAVYASQVHIGLGDITWTDRRDSVIEHVTTYLLSHFPYYGDVEFTQLPPRE
jgi:hypothetical protein